MGLWDRVALFVKSSPRREEDNVRNELFAKVIEIVRGFKIGNYSQFEAKISGDKITVTLLGQIFATIEVIYGEQKFFIIVRDRRGSSVFPYQTQSLTPSENEKRAIYSGLYDAIESLRKKLPRNIVEK